MEQKMSNHTPVKLRVKEVDEDRRYGFIYELAINIFNICQYLDVVHTKECCNLNVGIVLFERAAEFLEVEDKDNEAVQLMDAVLKMKDYLTELLGEDWEIRQMRELKDLDYLTEEEKALYEGYVSFLNLSNAVCLKNFDGLIFDIEDSVYCLENCSHFENPYREKVLALEKLEEDINRFSKRLAEYSIIHSYL